MSVLRYNLSPVKLWFYESDNQNIEHFHHSKKFPYVPPWSIPTNTPQATLIF